MQNSANRPNNWEFSPHMAGRCSPHACPCSAGARQSSSQVTSIWLRTNPSASSRVKAGETGTQSICKSSTKAAAFPRRILISSLTSSIESKKKIRFGPTRGAASPFRKASSRHHGSELTRATPSNCQARRYRRSGLSPRRSIEVQGLELLRMIRARNESVPIVVLSSRRLQGRFGQGKVVLHNPSQLARFMVGCLRGASEELRMCQASHPAFDFYSSGRSRYPGQKRLPVGSPSISSLTD